MKFNCERCQTRYSIGDEKVKGKVLKIRCKTCGNIIVVREAIPTVQGEASGFAQPQQREAAMAAVGAGAATPMATNPSLSNSGVTGGAAAQRAPQPARSSSAADHDWFVAIKGQQHGPAKAADVVRLFKEGRITERTYLWHDQLPSWTRLRDLPDFAAALAEGPGPKRPPPPPSEDGAEIVNFEAARAQRQKENNLGPVMNDPFASVGGAPGAGGDNAPRESTRVFIMQAGLHNRSKKQRVYAGVAVAVTLFFILICVVDYQLDIFGLKRVVNAVAVSTGIKEEPIDPGAAWDDGDAAITEACKTAADPAKCFKDEMQRLITQACKLRPDPAKCATEETARIVAKRKKRAIALGKPLSDADLNAGFAVTGDGSGAGTVKGTGVEDTGLIALNGGGPSAEEIAKRLAGGKGGPTGPKLTIGTPDVAGTTIDAENAGKVVRDGQPAIQACVDDAMKQQEDIPAKLRMTLSITTKGVVEKSVINDAVVQATSLGSCLNKSARRWKFAPPTEAADLEIPLVLR